MKNRVQPGKNSISLSVKSIKLIPILLSIFTLSFIAVVTVFAAATFGSVSGPDWLNPGYQLDAEVTALSEPHDNVCIEYSIDGGAANLESCTCSLPDCDSTTGIGTWACVISSNYSSAAISWDISAFPGGSCTGNKAQGPTGSFNTDPTAIELINFTIDDSKELSSASGFIIFGSLIAAAVILGALWNNRTRRYG